jgi:hypothetical protein
VVLDLLVIFWSFSKRGVVVLEKRHLHIRYPGDGCVTKMDMVIWRYLLQRNNELCYGGFKSIE